MDPYLPCYDQTYFASAYQHGPAISVRNYTVNPSNYASPAQPQRQQQAGLGGQPTPLSDEDSDSDVLPELTVKVFARGSGKNYVVRNVEVGSISSNSTFKQFVVREFGNEICGEAEDLEIGYFKGNKRVWIRTDDDYLEVLGKLRSGNAITLWCDSGTKSSGRKRVLADDKSDSDSDGTQRSSTSRLKRRKRSLYEEKNARVQEIFEKLKVRHGDKYTGPQYRLWAEAIDVNQHSSYDEHPQGSFFSAMQGRAHGIRKSGSSDVLSTAVTTLATSLAAALQPRGESSSICSTASGSSTPPQHKPRSPVITPVRAAQLKTTYINQIKELHSLVEIGALTTEQYEVQRDSILQQMDKLNPKI